MTSLGNRGWWAAVAIAVGSLMTGSALALQQVGTPQVSPTPLIVGAPQLVSVRSLVASDPALIRSSVNLVRRFPSGLVSVVSSLYDDGTHGDAVAGDGTYSAQVSLSIASAGIVEFAATAAYSNVVRRASSAYTNIPAIALVNLTAPANLSTLNSNRVNVAGNVNDPTTYVQVNGIPVNLTGTNFTAAIQLHEGNNTISAIASDFLGNHATASIQVTVDTTPPNVTIDTPRDGAVLSEPNATVTGLINDITVGTVGPNEAQVRVNGRSAVVANRTFLVANVPLVPGSNTLTAFGTDRAGNTNSYSINVFYNTSAANRIQIVSGNQQSGQIASLLPQPLVVRATDTNGNPCASKKVIFKVIQNDGLVTSAAATAHSLIVTSDVSGLAQVSFTLGTHAGVGNNQVSAGIVGFQGEAMFCASGSNSTPSLLVLDTGNNQVGVVGQPLAKPLGVAVVDTGFNRLPNVSVTFTVTAGGGSIEGQTHVTVTSDSNGRAVALLTLGQDAGNDNNQVQVNFPNNSGLPVTFVASGAVPGDPNETSISGVVLDNSDVPVPGARCRLVGYPNAVLSDTNGFFKIKPAPVGAQRLIVDGATVTRPGSWVWLQFDMFVIAGQDNTIGRPVRLLAMDIAHGMTIDATHGGTLTLPQVPGFSLTIQSNSVTFPDGSHSGLISVTVVHPDKMPDPPEFGQQPRFLVSIQPANALFNPPAPLCIPNVEGLLPGQKTEMYSYDHDMGQFVAIGTGTVSEDGSQICSDPGVGVVKAGWHCGGNPQQGGGAEQIGVTLNPQNLVFVVDNGALPSSKTISANGQPGPSGTPAYTWSSSGGITINPTQSQNGTATITPIRSGQSTLTVTYKCGSGQTASASANVVVVDIDTQTEATIPTNRKRNG